MPNPCMPNPDELGLPHWARRLTDNYFLTTDLIGRVSILVVGFHWALDVCDKGVVLSGVIGGIRAMLDRLVGGLEWRA
jgi:hypothetical protein